MRKDSDLQALPVSIDFYYLIGRVTVISSTLESSVWWFLNYLRHYHHQPDLDGWEYEDEKTRRFSEKVRAIRSLLRRRDWAPEETEFAEEWLVAVGDFREIRNDLAHSYWLGTEDNEAHSKYTLDERERRFGDGQIAIRQLRERVELGEDIFRRKNQVAELAIAHLWSPPRHDH